MFRHRISACDRCGQLLLQGDGYCRYCRHPSHGKRPQGLARAIRIGIAAAVMCGLVITLAGAVLQVG